MPPEKSEIKTQKIVRDECAPTDTPGSILSAGLCHIQKLERVCEKSEEQEAFAALVLRAREELKRDGITKEQREGYGPHSDRLYKNVTPFGYAILWKGVEYIFGPFEQRQVVESDVVMAKNIAQAEGGMIMKSRDDAWALYLGLPQKYGTFDISEYRPAKSTENKYYFSLARQYEDKIFTFVMQNIKALKSAPNQQKQELDAFAVVMGKFSVSLGKDEKGSYISYYDCWDLDPSYDSNFILGVRDIERFVGKPYEIYNRIYFDPSTGKRID